MRFYFENPFWVHSNANTFLKSAILTSITCTFIYNTHLKFFTIEFFLIFDSFLKKFHACNTWNPFEIFSATNFFTYVTDFSCISFLISFSSILVLFCCTRSGFIPIFMHFWYLQYLHINCWLVLNCVPQINIVLNNI